MPTVRSAFTKMVSVFVIFGFVKGPDDLWIYVAAIAGSYLANALLLWPFLKKYVDLCVPRWNEVKVISLQTSACLRRLSPAVCT